MSLTNAARAKGGRKDDEEEEHCAAPGSAELIYSLCYTCSPTLSRCNVQCGRRATVIHNFATLIWLCLRKKQWEASYDRHDLRIHVLDRFKEFGTDLHNSVVTHVFLCHTLHNILCNEPRHSVCETILQQMNFFWHCFVPPKDLKSIN